MIAAEMNIPREVAARFSGWALEPWGTPTGAVGYIWIAPDGSRFRVSANHDEKLALKSALRWFAAHGPERPLPALVPEIVHVCAWCPPEVRAPLEYAAQGSGAQISHGICRSCADVMRRGLTPAGMVA